MTWARPVRVAAAGHLGELRLDADSARRQVDVLAAKRGQFAHRRLPKVPASTSALYRGSITSANKAVPLRAATGS